MSHRENRWQGYASNTEAVDNRQKDIPQLGDYVSLLIVLHQSSLILLFFKLLI
jgi:hypothetical protein